MWKPILLLSLVLVGLVWWDGTLGEEDATRRAESLRIGRLISSEKQEELQGKVAFLQIEGAGRNWLYVPAAGRWRCLNFYGAPVKSGDVDGLISKIWQAEGVVQSEDPDRFGDYGIGPLTNGVTRAITLHGADAVEQTERGPSFRGDPLYAVEIGTAIPGRDGCYARLPGEEAVWAVDANPLPLLEVPEGALRPPMLDPYVIPTGWPGQGLHVDRIQVWRPDETYALELEQREVSEEELRSGVSPYFWTLKRGGLTVPSSEALTRAYTIFVYRAPFARVLDPGAVDEGLFTSHSASVTFQVRSQEGAGADAPHPSRSSSARAARTAAR